MKPRNNVKPVDRAQPVNCVEAINCAEPVNCVKPINCAQPVSSSNPINSAQPVSSANPMNCEKSTSSIQPPSWVYMVECRDGTLYTGWTTDLAKRVSAHSSGRGAKYTRSRAPVRLVYAEACAGKSAALRREAAIKKLTRAQKLALAAGWRAEGEASRTENDLIFEEECYVVCHSKNSQEK